MSDTPENVTFNDDLSIVGTFAARAERGEQGGVAPDVTRFIDTVPNGQDLLRQFAESYADFRHKDQPGTQTPAADYMSGFIGPVDVAREINISAINAGQGDLGRKAMHEVASHVDATLETTPKTPTPTTPRTNRKNGLVA